MFILLRYAFLGLFFFDIWSENVLFPYNHDKKCITNNYVYNYLRISASIACLIIISISSLFLLHDIPKSIMRFFSYTNINMVELDYIRSILFVYRSSIIRNRYNSNNIMYYISNTSIIIFKRI